MTFPKEELQRLYGEIEEVLATFETGPGFFQGETGFYYLASGNPMKAKAVAKRFQRIAAVANTACLALQDVKP